MARRDGTARWHGAAAGQARRREGDRAGVGATAGRAAGGGQRWGRWGRGEKVHLPPTRCSYRPALQAKGMAAPIQTPHPPTSDQVAPSPGATRPPRPQRAGRTARGRPAHARALIVLQQRLHELHWLHEGHADDTLLGRIAYLTELRALVRAGLHPARAPGVVWGLLSNGPAGVEWSRGVTLEARRWREKASAPRRPLPLTQGGGPARPSRPSPPSLPPPAQASPLPREAGSTQPL